jgi:hypothetical protein
MFRVYPLNSSHGVWVADLRREKFLSRQPHAIKEGLLIFFSFDLENTAVVRGDLRCPAWLGTPKIFLEMESCTALKAGRTVTFT